MANSSARKSKFLGMPYGTACARLRKQVLFELLKRHQENTCYRCQQPIENVDELSLEHKQGWEGVDPKLFWDLSNIAFSHLQCNVKQVSRNGSRPGKMIKNTVDGMKFCPGINHRALVPLSEFSRNKSNATGYEYLCRACRSEQRSNG